MRAMASTKASDTPPTPTPEPTPEPTPTPDAPAADMNDAARAELDRNGR